MRFGNFNRWIVSLRSGEKLVIESGALLRDGPKSAIPRLRKDHTDITGAVGKAITMTFGNETVNFADVSRLQYQGIHLSNDSPGSFSQGELIVELIPKRIGESIVIKGVVGKYDKAAPTGTKVPIYSHGYSSSLKDSDILIIMRDTGGKLIAVAFEYEAGREADFLALGTGRAKILVERAKEGETLKLW